MKISSTKNITKHYKLPTLLFCAYFVMACSSTPPIKKIFEVSETELAELKLAYYSDYFSFMGGFAMGIVTGEITIDGKQAPVYGLGELIL